MSLIELALSQANANDLVKRRSAGRSLSANELEQLSSLDLLVLGAAADRVRQADCGDEVRVYVGRTPLASERFLLVDDLEGKRGTDLFRHLAALRLSSPAGARVCLAYDQVGIEIAQVALAFGVSDLAGPVRGKNALPLSSDAQKALTRRAEIAGYIARAKRTAVFVDVHESLAAS
jgi:hypothetical protein